jgi:hypothetical protein
VGYRPFPNGGGGGYLPEEPPRAKGGSHFRMKDLEGDFPPVATVFRQPYGGRSASAQLAQKPIPVTEGGLEGYTLARHRIPTGEMNQYYGPVTAGARAH